MHTQFKKVLIMEPRTDVGRLLRDVVKELGASEVVITESVKDAWLQLQAADEPPDWIITEPDGDEKYSFWHIMQLVLNNDEFINTRISLVLNEDQLNVLPAAFDMGLLSYHKMPFTKVTLKGELEKLLKNLNQDPEEHYHTAAEYLRNYLNDIENYEQRINLEKSLVARFPKNPQHFVALAESQILADKLEDAKKTLSIAQHLGADFTNAVKQLNDLLTPELQQQQLSIAESFQIKRALIVDSDEIAAASIEQTLSKIGVTDIVKAENGEIAVDWLKQNGEPSLLLSEWKVPKLSGPALIQRVRQMGMISLPIIIQSSLVKESDKHLLREIGASAIVSKPVKMEHLISEIVTVMQRETLALSSYDLERKIRQLLEQKKADEAEKAYKAFVAQKDAPEGLRLQVEATIKFYKGEYEEARDIALLALKQKGEAVVLFNLLSKIFMKLNDNESALRCLNRAQEFSPDNIERLIMMAEVQSVTGEAEAAKQAIENAKKIDASSEVVMQAEAQVSINLGDSLHAKEILAQMDSAMSLIANMNNRAVLLVNAGNIEKAIEIYKSAQRGIPEHLKTERDIISYNLGLAHARLDQGPEAQEILIDLVRKTDNVTMQNKAKALLTRIDEALTNRKKITLNVSQKPNKLQMNMNQEKPLSIHLRPGQVCLHGIYDGQDFFFEEIKSTLANSPKFSRHTMATIMRSKAS